MNITENEAKVLRAIATNCFNHCNYDTPENYEEASGEVWNDMIDDAGIESGLDAKSLSGVCSSLNKKGYAKSDSETIRMSEAGWEAMMSYYNGDMTEGGSKGR